METWAQVRNIRDSIIDHCEVCHRQTILVGHHLIPRSVQNTLKPLFKEKFGNLNEFNHFFNQVALCRVRCRECEVKMHRIYTWGNNQADQVKANHLFREALTILV